MEITAPISSFMGVRRTEGCTRVREIVRCGWVGEGELRDANAPELGTFWLPS